MAIDTIKFKRGVKSKLNNLSYGEPAYISDENELYIGTENGVEKITRNKEVAELSSQLEHITHDFSINGWRNLPNSTKKIFFVGDSTLDIRVGYTLNSPTKCFYDKIYSKYTCSGGILEGVKLYPFGVSGASMEQFITNSFNSSSDRNTYNLDKLIEILNYEAKTYNNLVVFGYGHNGSPTLDKLDKWINDLNTCISRIIKETNSFIILQIPNNRADLEGTQTLYKAYKSLVGKYQRTELLDTQTLLFGTSNVTDTTLVGDGIHPTQLGYELRADLLCNFIVQDNVYLKNENPKNLKNDFTVSPNVLNIDDKYEKILSAECINKANNNISFWYDVEEASKLIRKGYILKVGNSKAIELPEAMKIFDYGVLEWSSNTSYSAGNIVKCGENYYECVESGMSGTNMPTLKTVIQDGTCIMKFKSDKKPTVISGINITGASSGLVEIFKVKNYVSKYDQKPVHGKWEQGDVVYKSNVETSGFIGWICTKAGIQDFNAESNPTWREF